MSGATRSRLAALLSHRPQQREQRRRRGHRSIGQSLRRPRGLPAPRRARRRQQPALALRPRVREPRAAGAAPAPARCAASRSSAGVLRQRREEAGLTQGEVAERAGLSEVLIRSIEVGRRRATPKTMKRLLAVRELRLRGRARHSRGAASAVRAAAPGDELVRAAALRRHRHARGSQAAAAVRRRHRADLLLPRSPERRRLVRSRQRRALRRHLPRRHAARGRRGAHRRARGQPPDRLIALGPGDGNCETRLAQALVDSLPEERRDIRYYLLDISLPLLSKSHRTAKDKVLTSKRRILA